MKAKIKIVLHRVKITVYYSATGPYVILDLFPPSTTFLMHYLLKYM